MLSLEEISVIRPGKESDFPYICNSWVVSNHDTPLGKQLGPDYKNRHSKLVWEWLPRSTVTVACDKDDTDAILGFLVRFHKVLHYVHVRRDFRRLGFARTLLDVDDLTQKSMTVTHQMSNVARYHGGEPRTFNGWKYDPYVFFAGYKEQNK